MWTRTAKTAPATARHGFVARSLAAVAAASLLGAAGCVNSSLGTKPQAASTGPSASGIANGTGGAGGVDLAKASVGRPAQDPVAPAGAGVGLGSGWLVGARKDLIDQKKEQAARAANDRSRRAPATIDDVRKAETADLNGDGFVTLDEIEAMQKAGLSDQEMIDRLQRTGQVFQLDDRQQDYLKDRGVSQRVIDAIHFLGHNPALPAGPA